MEANHPLKSQISIYEDHNEVILLLEEARMEIIILSSKSREKIGGY